MLQNVRVSFCRRCVYNLFTAGSIIFTSQVSSPTSIMVSPQVAAFLSTIFPQLKKAQQRVLTLCVHPECGGYKGPGTHCSVELSSAVVRCSVELSSVNCSSVTMATITGSFKLVSTSNMAAAFAVMGSRPNIISMFLFLFPVPRYSG